MMTSTKVAFPAPPPTTNSLTSQQRAQRLRTTKKLERILGSTPEWVDFADGTPSPNAPSCHFKTLSMPKRKPSRITKSTSLSSLSAMIGQNTSLPTRNSKSPPPPQLSLWPKRPLLSPVPASCGSPAGASFISSVPLSPSSTAVHSFQSSNNQIPHSSDSEECSLTTTFGKPVSQIRREKMDRVRRLLGQDVPVDMVFPAVCREAPAPAAPVLDITRPVSPAQPRIKKERSLPAPLRPVQHRISASRDSLIGVSHSPHHAPRRASTHPVIFSPSTPSTPYPASPPPVRRIESRDFLSLEDIPEKEAEGSELAIEEEVLDIHQRFCASPLRASKIGQIAAWAQLVSDSTMSSTKTQAPNNDSSEWFEDEDTLSDYELVFEGRAGGDDAHSCSTGPSDGPRAITPSNDLMVQCLDRDRKAIQLDLDDMIPTDADAAYLLQYQPPAVRWDWGVPRETLPPVGIGKGTRNRAFTRDGEDEEVGIEALALSGMMIY